MDSVGSVESIGRHFNPLALTSQKVVVLVDENTFLAWKQHVLLVLKTQCLRSFIDGTITVPPRILVDADGSSVENSAYIQYEQQDSNLAAWLLSILDTEARQQTHISQITFSVNLALTNKTAFMPSLIYVGQPPLQLYQLSCASGFSCG
ncbi:hypothetical protein PVK06_000908 [Gossypium arboreum]|uniref:Uncharacterized protein n=1 Tax=Gossypium arboreum TaxID=29729 RepID=A0ABR0QZM0_GOSAR|nr:hypothetical protein PVK06_000908 [Gossypium arboreum]